MPPPDSKRIALHVTRAAERALRAGHPWLFENSIRQQNREGKAGDLAVAFDRKDRFLAVGLYDPHSPIRVKLLQHNTPAPIGRDWFRQKLAAAAGRRAPLRDDPHTDGYRLVHGENDGLPSLIVDRYAGTLVVKLYTAAWLPHLRAVLPPLVEIQPARRLVLRLSRRVQALSTPLQDGRVIPLERAESVEESGSAEVLFQENGLTFAADVVHGHKTGFFFDQRENRARVGRLAQGRRVLDVFAYTGGFSLYAARGGARSVLSLDVSAPALAAARHNFALNRDDPNVAGADHSVMIMDAFEGLAQLAAAGRAFDLIVVDPPAFAKTRSDVDKALGAYQSLTRLALDVLVPQGILVMASCSSRVAAEDFYRTILHAAEAHGRPLWEQARSGHALDHPIGFPEGAYLKCLFASTID